MANREDLQFSGIEEGHILKSQIKTLADVITGEKNGRYIKQYGGFEDFFRLIIYGKFHYIHVIVNCIVNCTFCNHSAIYNILLNISLAWISFSS